MLCRGYYYAGATPRMTVNSGDTVNVEMVCRISDVPALGACVYSAQLKLLLQLLQTVCQSCLAAIVIPRLVKLYCPE